MSKWILIAALILAWGSERYRRTQELALVDLERDGTAVGNGWRQYRTAWEGHDGTYSLILVCPIGSVPVNGKWLDCVPLRPSDHPRPLPFVVAGNHLQDEKAKSPEEGK